MDVLGSEVARRYGVRGVPTLIVFDGSGDVAGQAVGVPNRSTIVGLVDRLLLEAN